jgi:hypothetical protein
MAIGVVFLIALICLLLGHNAIEGYLEKQPPRLPDAPADSGGAGKVVYADGSPAAAARVRVDWLDSAGRPGSTPATTDAAGRIEMDRIPVKASVTEASASVGPLLGVVAGPGNGGAPAPLRITLPDEFKLAGMIRRAGDRSPVAGATVEIAGVKVSAGNDGGFKLDHVAAAVLRADRPIVHIAAAGYAPLDWPLPLDDLPETYGDLTILLEASK